MEWIFGKNKDKVKEESRCMYQLCIKRAESIGKAEYISSNGSISLVDIYKKDMLRCFMMLWLSR